MAISPEVAECLEAIGLYNEAWSKLNKIRNRLMEVTTALSQRLDTFYFTDISAPSDPAITLQSKHGITGADWPQPDDIQKLVVDCFNQKTVGIKALNKLSGAQRKMINVPTEWNVRPV